jgi:hypothetical protein
MAISDMAKTPLATSKRKMTRISITGFSKLIYTPPRPDNKLCMSKSSINLKSGNFTHNGFVVTFFVTIREWSTPILKEIKEVKETLGEN